MARKSNIYDLVEREAARSGIPRIDLWQPVANALIEGRLPALNLAVQVNPNISPQTFAGWLIGFKAAVDRYNDPHSQARILKCIIVRVSDFKKWRQHNLAPGRRGPRRNTTGHRASDRKLYPRIKKLINSGEAGSAYGAALLLKDDIAGGGTIESRAKRVSARYRKENPDTH